jgi:DNA polymerase I-like protein with 3'-5' exonuclease and polymerase domains
MIEKKYYTVNDKETVKLLLQHIEESEEIAYDTETNSLNVRQGKIVGFSMSGDVGIGFYMPTMIFNKENDTLEEVMIEGIGAHKIASNIIGKLKGKRIICHNASFDMRFTKNFYGIDLIEDLYIDTAMLVHTVNEEGAFGFGNPFALKAIAQKHQEELGLDIETAANQEQLDLKESIKRNGGSTTKDNFEIYKADIEILSKYAAADTDLTLRVCHLFLEKLKEEGLEKFFFEEEVMPIYKEVTIPMEEFGVELDLELIEKTKYEIEADMKQHSEEAMAELMSLEKVQQWVLEKAIEAYPPNNKGTFAQKLLEQANVNLPRSEKSGKFSINKATVKLLEEGPIKSYLLDGNTDHLETNQILKVSMALWKEDNDGKYFNLQSKDQLGKIAFDALGMKPLSTTTTGKPQFDDEFIDTIADKHPWAQKLQIYNRLLKIKSTYVDRFWERQENGRYYFYFKQNGTVSGRYGSDLQQLPKPREEGEALPIVIKYTNLVRAFLVAEKGRIMIDCDYESLEPHCFASVSEDENLQEIFNKNWDFYSTVAIKTEKLDEDKVNYPNGVSADKKSPVFLKKLNPVKRNTAKGYALGIAYGMEAFALAKGIDVSREEAEKLVEGYLNGFPGLKKWREGSRAFVKENGYIKNKVGRIRHLPTVKEVYSSMGDKLMDWKYRKELEREYGLEKVTNLYRSYRNGLNNCLNFQLQSLAAAVVNRAAVQINRELKKMGIDGRVQAQVHDQLIINVPEEHAEVVAAMVKDKMENTTKLEGVTLKAPPAIAKNMRDGH